MSAQETLLKIISQAKTAEPRKTGKKYQVLEIKTFGWVIVFESDALADALKKAGEIVEVKGVAMIWKV